MVRSYYDEVGKTFGEILRRRRAELGLSQEYVAFRAGIAPYTYFNLEGGNSRPGSPANPQLRTLLAIAKALEMPLHDLVFPLHLTGSAPANLRGEDEQATPR